jgi:hypothetical protein
MHAANVVGHRQGKRQSLLVMRLQRSIGITTIGSSHQREASGVSRSPFRGRPVIVLTHRPHGSIMNGISRCRDPRALDEFGDQNNEWS